MKCHKLPWKQRGTVLSNAISRRRQSPSKLQASKPPPMVLLQYFMPVVSRIVKNFKISFKKKFDTEYSEKKSGGRDGQASFIAFIRNVIGQILNVLFPPGFQAVPTPQIKINLSLLLVKTLV